MDMKRMRSFSEDIHLHCNHSLALMLWTVGGFTNGQLTIANRIVNKPRP